MRHSPLFYTAVPIGRGGDFQVLEGVRFLCQRRHAGDDAALGALSAPRDHPTDWGSVKDVDAR